MDELVYGGLLADLGLYASGEAVGDGGGGGVADGALVGDYHDRGYINADAAMNVVDLIVADGAANVHVNVVVVAVIVVV